MSKIASWFKRQWKAIILILVGIALLVSNICVLLYVSDINSQSAWLTLFSGWVSGLATIALGIVAVVQNRKYKKENDRYLKEQQELNWRLEQKDLIKAYLNNFESIFSNVKEYQYSKLISNWTINFQQGTFTLDELIYDKILNELKDSMIFATVNNIYYFDGIENLLDMCCGYTLKLRILLKQLPEIIKNKEVKLFNEVSKLYKDLCTKFNEHIFQVRLFIDMIMTNGIYKDVENALQEKRDKQADWRKRMKTAHEEMIKNGKIKNDVDG